MRSSQPRLLFTAASSVGSGISSLVALGVSGTVAAAAVAFSSVAVVPLFTGVVALVAPASAPPSAATLALVKLAGSGAAFRLGVVPLSLYGDRAVSRMAQALPEVQVAFQQYLAVTNHPRAILWEKKAAAQKFSQDRQRIFMDNGTDNLRTSVPHISAAAWCCYAGLGYPAQAAAEAILSEPEIAVAVGDALTGNCCSAALACIPIAACITTGNVWMALSRRNGFNDRFDALVMSCKRYVGAIGALIAGSAAADVVQMARVAVDGTTDAAAATSVIVSLGFPAYLGPIWLGIALAGLVFKTLPVAWPWTRRNLLRFPDYPPEHGTYGSHATGIAHEYRLAAVGVDPDEQYHQWQKNKITLEFDCDTRLHSMAKRVGLFSDLDDFVYEMERTSKRRELAAERRRREWMMQASGAAKTSTQEKGGAGSGSSQADVDDMQPAPGFQYGKGREDVEDRRRRSDSSGNCGGGPCKPGGGYITDESVVDEMDRQMYQENLRRNRKFGGSRL